MTRRNLMNEIKDCFDKADLTVDEDARKGADISVDCTLDYILRYILSLNEELITHGLHSQAMTANIIAHKVKGLMNE